VLLLAVVMIMRVVMAVGMVMSAAATIASSVRMFVIVVVRVAMTAAAAALMRVGVRVIVAVTVIMRMIVSASATVAVTMVMMVGIDERGGQTALERNRLLARSVAGFDGQSHHLGAEAQVIYLAEIVAPEPALAVEHEDRRRAADLVGLHGLRDIIAVGLVEGDRESELVFVDARTEY
jgi:hypothetical protein